MARFAKVPVRLIETAGDSDMIAIYAVLASHADREGRAFPSLPRIARMTGLARSTTHNALSRLREMGWVEWTQTERGGPNRYRLRVPSDDVSADLRPDTDASTPSGERTTPVRSPDHPRPSTGLPPSGHRTLTRVNELEPPNQETSVDVNQQGALVEVTENFDRFWVIAVRKTGKGAARKKFAEALEKVDLNVLARAWVVANQAWATWPDKTLIPHPATWLSQERWDDDAPQPHRGQGDRVVLREFAQRMDESGLRAKDLLANARRANGQREIYGP